MTDDFLTTLHATYKRNDTVLGTYTVVNRRAIYCYCFWYDIFLHHVSWFYAEIDYL